MVIKSTPVNHWEWQAPRRALSAAILSAVALVLLNVIVITAQSPSTPPPPAADAPLPSFEVVTIKPNRSGVISSKFAPNQYQVTMKNAMFFVRLAYGPTNTGRISPLREDQAVGEPRWADTKFYDVDAKFDDATAARFQQHPEDYLPQLRLMLQSFLADRFKLRVSHTTRTVSGLALMVGKDGPKFLDKKMTASDKFPAPSQSPKGTPCVPKVGWACMATFMSMDALAGSLSGLRDVDQPVVNQTGIDGNYFIYLEFEHSHRPVAMFSAENASSSDASAPPPGPGGPTIEDALRKQLGLVLKTTKVRTDIVVIDHIEPPTEN